MSAGLANLDPRFAPWAQYLLQVAQLYLSRGAVVTSGYRSYATQARLYRRFLAGLSAYPALPPGSSMHEYGLAVDLGGLTPDQLSELGAWWRSLGGRWGPEDDIHFEA